jgi:hypothetical protein
MGFQSGESPNFENFGIPDLGKSQKNYKGEGGGFFQVWAMVNLVNLCMPVACLCTKSVPTMH